MIRTENLINDKVWKRMKERYGDNGENPRLKYCPFQKYAKSYYSQNGEEGILEFIFEKIGMTNKHCVEFGAGDGVTISNTYYFHQKYGFIRTLIEGNKHTLSQKRTSELFVESLVTSDNINTLIEHVPDTYDLLSIDIDGDDYWVWKNMKKKARVVILEYHAGIPNDIPVAIIESKGEVNSQNFAGPQGMTFNGYYGANLKAFYRLAEELGYKFVTTISDNAIFVLKSEFKKLDIYPIDEHTCMENFFNPVEYWSVTHRDRNNNEWVILQ